MTISTINNVEIWNRCVSWQTFFELLLRARSMYLCSVLSDCIDIFDHRDQSFHKELQWRNKLPRLLPWEKISFYLRIRYQAGSSQSVTGGKKVSSSFVYINFLYQTTFARHLQMFCYFVVFLRPIFSHENLLISQRWKWMTWITTFGNSVHEPIEPGARAKSG